MVTLTTNVDFNEYPVDKNLRLFVLATKHTLLHMFLNIWCQMLFLGDLHVIMLLFGIFVQLSVEPLIAHAVCNSQHA